MTITFKPGHHPDADQLSAFVEQALPAHERDGVLAHLAVCAECRGVVALALPEVPAALPATEPRSWFTGWMVFLPAAAAVAALTVFIFFVRRQSPAPAATGAEHARYYFTWACLGRASATAIRFAGPTQICTCFATSSDRNARHSASAQTQGRDRECSDRRGWCNPACPKPASRQ